EKDLAVFAFSSDWSVVKCLCVSRTKRHGQTHHFTITKHQALEKMNSAQLQKHNKCAQHSNRATAKKEFLQRADVKLLTVCVCVCVCFDVAGCVCVCGCGGVYL